MPDLNVDQIVRKAGEVAKGRRARADQEVRGSRCEVRMKKRADSPTRLLLRHSNLAPRTSSVRCETPRLRHLETSAKSPVMPDLNVDQIVRKAGEVAKGRSARA